MMSEEPRPEQFINIEGPRGESLFRRLLIWLIPRNRVARLQKELDDYWAHYRHLADERAVVLVGALCVEDSLDGLIWAFFPKSKSLLKNRDFSFSLKIDIVRSCKLIPSRILSDCDLIRRLRNDFAHHLNMKTLSDWGDRKFQAVDQALTEYQLSYDFSVPLRKRFEDLVAFVCVALKMYTTHVRSARKFIDTDDFINSLKDFKERKKKA